MKVSNRPVWVLVLWALVVVPFVGWRVLGLGASLPFVGAIMALLLVPVWIGRAWTLWDVRTDGYVLEYRKNGQGRWRWRVGVADVAPTLPAVRWIPPGAGIEASVKLDEAWSPDTDAGKAVRDVATKANGGPKA